MPSGNLSGGTWWFPIGRFVQGSAEGTYRQTLIDGIFHRHPFRMSPVVEGDRLVGSVEPSDVRGPPREAWGERRVADILRPCDGEDTVSPDLGGAEAAAGSASVPGGTLRAG